MQGECRNAAVDEVKPVTGKPVKLEVKTAPNKYCHTGERPSDLLGCWAISLPDSARPREGTVRSWHPSVQTASCWPDPPDASLLFALLTGKIQFNKTVASFL